jgi:hypothetical protein
MLATAPPIDCIPTDSEVESTTIARQRPSAASGWSAFGLSGDSVVVLNHFLLHPAVSRLKAGAFSANETEDLMSDLRREIVAGNYAVATQLAGLVLMPYAGAPDVLDAQCLAIEILAAARLPQLSPLLHAVMRRALTSSNSDLEFAAIAALSDLSRYQRELYRPLVELVAAKSRNTDVLDAAQAFLKTS